ncbi:MAG: glycosyltransferase [Lachnospiraceae bacterium]|nr:glycosyltransferase [Lachnospiraceae bacterium]
MKKLLITASTFPRWENDTEPRFILDCAIELNKYYDVTVLVPAAPGSKKSEVLDGVNVVRYHYFPIHKLETLCYPGAIVPRIKEKKIRVLLVPFLFASLFFKLLFTRKKYDLFISNWIIPQGIIHAFFSDKYIQVGLGGDVTSLNKGILKTLKKRCVEKSPYIVVVSDDLKSSLIENYQLDENKIEVVPMGVNLAKFSPANRIENYFNQGDKKVILFVGRLVEKKGTEYLIKAMKDIQAKLIIVGDGPQRDYLVELANGIGSDIEFVGSKNKDELIKMYASCDIFCLPAVLAKDGDKDGTPVALIEAMASGAVPVGTNVGGVGEVIKHEINGLIVEDRDENELHSALESLLKNDELRAVYSAEARKRAEEFDFIKIGERYKELLEEYC